MSPEDALGHLEDMLMPDEEPTLDAAQVERLLRLAAAPDADGRPPTHEDWDPTYSLRGLYYAAREGWLRKAAKAAGRFDFSTDSQNFRRSQQADRCEKMAARYTAKLASSVGVGK